MVAPPPPRRNLQVEIFLPSCAPDMTKTNTKIGKCVVGALS